MHKNHYENMYETIERDSKKERRKSAVLTLCVFYKDEMRDARSNSYHPCRAGNGEEYAAATSRYLVGTRYVRS